MTAFVTTSMVETGCSHAGCALQFCVPRAFFENAKHHGLNLYCPRGHRMTFGESTLDKVRRKAERLERERDSARRERDKAEHGRATIRGKLKATKERIANGVCPCCKRSFANLRRHMASKHPGYGDDDTTEE